MKISKTKIKSFLGNNEMLLSDIKKPLTNLVDLWFIRAVIGLINLNALDISHNEDYSILDIQNDKSDEEKSNELYKYLLEKEHSYKKYSNNQIYEIYPCIRDFSKRFGVRESESIILLFLIIMKTHRRWMRLMDVAEHLTHKEMHQLVSKILNIRHGLVKSALSRKSALEKKGLIEVDPRNDDYIATELYTILDGLEESHFSITSSLNNIENKFLTKAKVPDVNKEDFDYINDRIEQIINIISSHSSSSVSQSTHILLYGAPGVGKTVLASLIGKILDRTVHYIPFSDNNSEDSGKDRFRKYIFSQTLLSSNKNAILLFDELEDLFPSHFGAFFQSSGNMYKGWINEGLEKSVVPTIWTTNDISGIDKAHLRRFDLIIEIPKPPSSVRKRLLTKLLNKYKVSKEWIDEFSQIPELSPAYIKKLAQLAQRLNISGHELEKGLSLTITQYLKSIGVPITAIKPKLPIDYNVNYLNSTLPVNNIISGISESKKGRLCLYGPPGTGKSEFAHHLSNSIERPLIKKRASDLLDCYVGMTEMKIADMFYEAQQENAVLLLDEADSFLRDRNGAKTSWEVTQVNELLVQMESFNGIFIASTNLIDTIDEASIRRFDLKIYFDYLPPEVAYEMFTDALNVLGLNNDDPDHFQKQFSRLDMLTPGDFATVMRKNNIIKNLQSPVALLDSLREEIAAKKDNINRSIGFVS